MLQGPRPLGLSVELGQGWAARNQQVPRATLG